MSNLYSLLCLLIITSLLCAQGEEFKKLDLKNGQIQLSLSRTLDTLPNTTIPAITSDYYLAMAVSANFGEEYYQQQNLSEDATIQMQIIISRSQSGLNAVDSTCVYDIGSHFQCQAPLCTEIMSSPQTIHYPLFSSINVTTLNLTNPGVISLADGSWQLDTSPLYIHNCQASILTTASSGWIGLGLSGNGASNFKAANPIFSLLFNASAQTKSAQIIFGFNSTCINPSKPAITLHSDSDWKLNVSRVNFGNMTSNFSQGIPLIFDVLTRKTILPQPQTGEIMNQIFNYPGMQCGTSDFFIVTIICVGFVGYKKGWWLKSRSFIGEGNINVELRRNEMVEEVPETI